MDLNSPQSIKDLLSKYGAKPSKGLGQNFLIDKNILDKIIDSANLNSADFVLEVGPGLGTLTQELAKRAGQVVAVEKDENMIEILKETLPEYKNVEVLNEDILKYNPQQTDYKLIANIPYYLTSPLIRKFLESKNPPKEIILMIQKEVAERICAKAGDMSLLAVSVQFYAEAKIISSVSKNCFWPAPKIDSAIIKIIPFAKPDINPEDFFKVVKAGFSHPRKQLLGNLSGELNLTKEKTTQWLSKNNIDTKQRAETLSIQDWKNLTNSF